VPRVVGRCHLAEVSGDWIRLIFWNVSRCNLFFDIHNEAMIGAMLVMDMIWIYFPLTYQ